MSSYSITIELPYHICDIIDQLVVAFPDVDFNDWNYDDEPCNLLGYEHGDYPPNDFFHSDKFYVQIDSYHSVRFEFDDKQQSVYIQNGLYVCDYFTTKLANFFPQDYFTFTILDQYGYLNNDYLSSDNDNLDDLYQFMDEIERDNALADIDYYNFTYNNHNNHNIVCRLITNKPTTLFTKSKYPNYNVDIVDNNTLFVTFPNDTDLDFVYQTMNTYTSLFNNNKNDYLISF